MIDIIKQNIQHIEEIELLDELKSRRNKALKHSLRLLDAELGLLQQIQYLFYDNLVSKFEKYLREKEV